MVAVLEFEGILAQQSPRCQGLPGEFRRVKTLPVPAKSRRRLFLINAFCTGFSLGLEGAEPRIDNFGNVQVDSFLPVHFFRM
jgi:hypothetical protein